MSKSSPAMTSFERLSAVLRRKTPDRVPVVLVSSTHGAKELGLSVRDYFSRPEYLAEGETRFVERVGHDNVNAFYYFGREAEAFGAEIIFAGDAPPVVSAPILRDLAAIDTLEAPDPATSPPLKAVLEATQLLANRAKGRWFVIARALGPHSLPILLLGIERWLELLLFGNRGRYQRMLDVAAQFSVAWSRALLAAGADVVALVEPMASTTMLTKEQVEGVVFPSLKRVINEIGGPVILWSLGSIHEVAHLVPDLGVVAVSTDPNDDIADVKHRVGDRLIVLGGLNDLGMLSWTPDEAREEARRAIERGAPGGRFILSHQYEIPSTVEYDVLKAIVDAAAEWGRYADNPKGRDYGRRYFKA